jgi:hypothetical protein
MSVAHRKINQNNFSEPLFYQEYTQKPKQVVEKGD